MRVALAQINSHLGQFEKNRQKILEFTRRAVDRRADIVVFPEASLFGYHPMDLLEREEVVEEQLKILDRLHRQIPPGILVLVGAFTKNPTARGKPYFNSAVALVRGQKAKYFHKELLPTYDVFDDARHIEPGETAKNILKYKGQKILVTICEDIWAWPTSRSASASRRSLYESNPLKEIRSKDVDLVLNLSASPFYGGKLEQRLEVTRATTRHFSAPIVYVNLVGGQDELIFDGGSFALNHRGQKLVHSAHFVEDLSVVDFALDRGNAVQEPSLPIEEVRQALVLGIRDFVAKAGLSRVHLGLSGGIDSAVVACLASDAIGPQNVSAYALPGPHSTELSLQLAESLAKNLNIKFKKIEFNSVYEGLVELLDRGFGQTEFGLMHENIQARLRGVILMAASNRESSLLLNTSNKDEMAAGYGTLYGDLCGGLSPIGDLLKGDIYALAELYNSEHELIPREIITRPPTAELRPNQKDSDSLPAYDELDKSVVRLVEKRLKARSQTDKWLLSALKRSEFKRWQAPPILKVREHSFGRGRRMPI
jgi:NAD+ synthase (glutamine-hydrolysing)